MLSRYTMPERPADRSDVARIEWRESGLGYSSTGLPDGHVDGVRLFTISWRGGKETPWAITTSLPGVSVHPAASVDDARARCERVLERWLTRMTNATAPDPAPTGV
jgi:hypothetical protein